jgi:hypothetical protein
MNPKYGLALSLGLAIAGLGLSYAPPAWSQLRAFPDKTKVGLLQMGNFPEAQIDGKRILFAAGGRILNESNLSVVPMSVQGSVRIRYRLDPMGQVMIAWILSEQEAKAAKQEPSKDE